MPIFKKKYKNNLLQEFDDHILDESEEFERKKLENSIKDQKQKN